MDFFLFLSSPPDCGLHEGKGVCLFCLLLNPRICLYIVFVFSICGRKREKGKGSEGQEGEKGEKEGEGKDAKKEERKKSDR